jgi:hypothetical protein
MKSSVSQFLQSERGSVLISVIIGFGLATLFRRVCRGKGCVVVKSPPVKDLKKYVYRIDGRCYKYRPYATSCTGTPETSNRSST